MTLTNLPTVVRAIAKLVEPLARPRQLRVHVVSTAPAAVRGDATQIEQVVSNLVVNAIQACADGGSVELSCGVAPRPELEGDQDRPWAFVSVSDDGSGMTQETMQYVFEPFFTTKDVGQGTGLGLSVAHGIVQDHGGSIMVESEVGRGSTFTVLLPVVSS